MRIALDTNVIGYAEGLDDAPRQARAAGVIAHLRDHDLVLPVQVAAELHRLVMLRRKITPQQASAVVRHWTALMPMRPETTLTIWDYALQIADDHRLQIFDAIILAAASEAGCRLLLSEDMGDGFVWGGVTVANPFAATPHPLLADLLRG